MSTFGGGHSLHQQCAGSVRVVCALGPRKLDHTNTIPYLFSRLGEPGYKELAFKHFESTGVELHRPLTLKFLGPDSPLRDAALALPNAGGPLPCALQLEVEVSEFLRAVA